MTDKTKQMILDAALKIFSQKGYKAANIKDMAKKAGFNEKTIYRRFKTKKNLYNMVLLTNLEKFKLDLGRYVFVDKKFETPTDFFEYSIKITAKVFWDNFEFFYISINEQNEIIEGTMEEVNDFVGFYIEQNIPNLNIDYKIFGFSIANFIYRVSLERYLGGTYLDYEEFIDRFTKYCIQFVSTTQNP